MYVPSYTTIDLYKEAYSKKQILVNFVHMRQCSTGWLLLSICISASVNSRLKLSNVVQSISQDLSIPLNRMINRLLLQLPHHLNTCLFFSMYSYLSDWLVLQVLPYNCWTTQNFQFSNTQLSSHKEHFWLRVCDKSGNQAMPCILNHHCLTTFTNQRTWMHSLKAR